MTTLVQNGCNHAMLSNHAMQVSFSELMFICWHWEVLYERNLTRTKFYKTFSHVPLLLMGLCVKSIVPDGQYLQPLDLFHQCVVATKISTVKHTQVNRTVKTPRKKILINATLT